MPSDYVCIFLSGINTKSEHSEDNAQFELSTVVIVAGIIGGTVVLAVAIIVCGVVYIQKYKYVRCLLVSVQTAVQKLIQMLAFLK